MKDFNLWRATALSLILTLIIYKHEVDLLKEGTLRHVHSDAVTKAMHIACGSPELIKDVRRLEADDGFFCYNDLATISIKASRINHISVEKIHNAMMLVNTLKRKGMNRELNIVNNGYQSKNSPVATPIKVAKTEI